MAENYDYPYGLAGSADFRLFLVNGDIATGIAFVAGDAFISVDNGAFAAFDETQITEIGRGWYQVAFTQAHALNEKIIISLVDQAAKVFMDRGVHIQFKNRNFGSIYGMATGTPTQTNIPTDITATNANSLAGRIITFINGVNDTTESEIVTNTSGANSALTITATAAAQGAVPIIIP